MIKRQRNRLSARKGLALPLALGAIVIIGMILAGVFFTATQENRVGRNTIQQERAFRGAEFGLNNAYARWNNSQMNNLATGGTTVTVDDSSKRGWIDSVQATRLNNNTYMLVSTAYSGSGITLARHRTSAVYRVNFPSISFLAALTAHGNIKLGGSSFIDGHDTPPTGWGCPPGGTEQPGVAVGDSDQVSLAGCTNLKCVDGNPDLYTTTAVNDTNTFFNYGNGVNWQSLTAAATLTLTSAQASTSIWPDSIGNTCNTATLSNWGDPTRTTPAGACQGYFPVIYISDSAGTTHITGGMGQGILLVEGDLLVDGGFQWYGPVIARGHVSTQGTGGHFNGAVMAADVDLELNSVLGNALVTYSSCAISQALAGAGVPKRLLQRSWAEMYYH
jgi:hypothetical protein